MLFTRLVEYFFLYFTFYQFFPLNHLWSGGPMFVNRAVSNLIYWNYSQGDGSMWMTCCCCLIKLKMAAHVSMSQYLVLKWYHKQFQLFWRKYMRFLQLPVFLAAVSVVEKTQNKRFCPSRLFFFGDKHRRHWIHGVNTSFLKTSADGRSRVSFTEPQPRVRERRRWGAAASVEC